MAIDWYASKKENCIKLLQHKLFGVSASGEQEWFKEMTELNPLQSCKDLTITQGLPFKFFIPHIPSLIQVCFR